MTAMVMRHVDRAGLSGRSRPGRPPTMSISRTRLSIAALASVAVLGTTAGAVTAQKSKSDVESVVATLKSTTGAEVGTVEFRKSPRSAVQVHVALRGLPPGFHGFHVHTMGRCDAPDFKSAMGHLSNPGNVHGAHKGDLPSLLVKNDGTASLDFQTDKFNLDDLQDADGSAVMVHALPDNFGNIPQRYAATTDKETNDTGDAGARIACGTVAPR